MPTPPSAAPPIRSSTARRTSTGWGLQSTAEGGGGPYYDDRAQLGYTFFWGAPCGIPAKTGNAYSLGAKAETRNPFAVAAELLLRPGLYVGGADPAKDYAVAAAERLHLKSLYECYEIAEETIGVGNDATGGADSGEASEAALRARCEAPTLLGPAFGRAAGETVEGCLNRPAVHGRAGASARRHTGRRAAGEAPGQGVQAAALSVRWRRADERDAGGGAVCGAGRACPAPSCTGTISA